LLFESSESNNFICFATWPQKSDVKCCDFSMYLKRLLGVYFFCLTCWHYILYCVDSVCSCTASSVKRERNCWSQWQIKVYLCVKLFECRDERDFFVCVMLTKQVVCIFGIWRGERDTFSINK
jgi:hypothetical protein